MRDDRVVLGWNGTQYAEEWPQNIPKGNLRQGITSLIEQGSIEIVYQPIVDHKRGVVFGHESLSRPQFEGQAVPPDRWFHAAYLCDLSVQADFISLSAGVNNFRLLPSQNTATLLFINIMPSSLSDASFLEQLEGLLADGPCLPEQLVFEIVEYVPYNPQALVKSIGPLRSLGVKLCLDDVGIGSANLAALVHMEPDFVKIDRSLIEGISLSPPKQRLLSQLVGYMESGYSVIAEGIETEEDLSAVQNAGVNLSQGYYWAHPMPVERLIHDMTNHIVKEKMASHKHALGDETLQRHLRNDS